MKKMIIDSIKQLKKEGKSLSSRQQSLIDCKTQQMDGAPKRRNADRAEDYTHRLETKGKLFADSVFCFPVADLDLTPRQIELLSSSIVREGGKVVKFAGKVVQDKVDFVAISPKLRIDDVRGKIDGKISYKEIIDYHFVTNILKDNRTQDYEKYSLYINIEALGMEEKQGSAPSKKQKVDEEEQSNITIKLSDDQEEQKPQQKSFPISKPIPAQDKIDIEQLVLQGKKENDFSMNKFIADQLTKLMKIYATERDIGRKMAYMKAASVIRGLDKEIESERDVQNLRGIGDKIAKKIKELLETGRINKLETLQNSQKNIARGKLSEVWGIGPSKANELYAMGIKTIEQLQLRPELLNKNQRIGLKYYEDFQAKIPREKVGKMFQFVRNVVETMVPSLDLYCIEACGSYRRGRKECGDIDIIISRKDKVYEPHFLGRLVKELQQLRFLTDHLSLAKPGQGRGSMSYMGVCQFQDSTHHRIDIKYYPIEEYAFAILHFTGNSAFNRMLRLHTMKLGLQLSDKGAHPKAEKGVIWSHPIPVCYTEQDIFSFLGLEYKSPLQREM